jgi:iron complex transport system ATP-binding protein
VTTLSADHLTVRRKGLLILDDVTCSASSGDFVAVIGANGAGKSTLLAALAGLLKPFEGDVTLDGVSLKILSAAALARRRAYLPQNPRCEWPLSVERLVALGLTPVLPALGPLPASYRHSIESVLTACNLLCKRLQPATTLSGGELARAMLARALVSNPEALIVDEPTAGLDPRHTLDAAGRLRGLAQAGKLVVAAFHDLTLVARYATRVLALQGGRLIAEGPVTETLTPQLLHALFGVDAHVAQTPRGPVIDYESDTPSER